MASRQKSSLLGAIALIAFCLIAFFGQWIVSPTMISNEQVAIWFFDVGQGDAILIQSGSEQILIDGGPSDLILEKLSSVMPFWDRTIELVISTHPHADHLTGLNAVLDRYEVLEVWRPDQPYESDCARNFLDSATVSIVSSPTCEIIGPSRSLCILWPKESFNGASLEDENDGSLVLLFRDGENEILLTGDTGEEEEVMLAKDLVDVDVLKVGHHGSLQSTSSDFLQKIQPEIAVISVGENSYGHPSQMVLDRLISSGAEVLRTDIQKDIRLLSNGVSLEMASFDF
ncbi:MAG: MBL fold metallo-hydrolase [Patescibacteria group bacterium]|jgi:competence protein ComEC